MKVIVCAGTNGRAVIIGECDEMPEIDQPCELRDARMVLRWDAECGGLLGLAARGPRADTRITAAVPVTRCTAREVVEVTDAAAQEIDSWPAC